VKVLVLGAGVIGVSAAYELAGAGHEVAVLERQPGAGLETSFANAGEVSPGYSAPWAGPGVPLKAIKWLAMHHRPLVIRPNLDWSMIRWSLAMLRNCTAARYRINKTRMVRLAEYSRDVLRDLRDETGIAYDQRTQGTLQLFRTQKQLDGVTEDTAVLDAYRVPYEVLDPTGCIDAAVTSGQRYDMGPITFEQTPKLGVEESRDDGRSWQYLADIPVAEEDQRESDWRIRMEDEPHVVELKDGKLVAMIRADPRDHTQSFLRQTESTDGGKTWSVTHKTSIYGYPPHLIRLRNDWLLVVYGVRREPFGERACLSKDGGKTWDIDHEITLRTAFSSDLGYPSSVQLDDGSILTVYYQSAQPGDKTSLLSTHWKLNEK